MRTTVSFVFVFLYFIGEIVYGQCSDAGVCIIGQKGIAPQDVINASYKYGNSGDPDKLNIQTAIINAEFQVYQRSRVTAEIGYSRQSGTLGTVSGISDLIVVSEQTIADHIDSKLTAHLGARVALADVNAGNLPQKYQSGLGTNDVLFGLMYEKEEWDVSAAYQYSRERSANRITRLKRGDDLLVRGGYKLVVRPFVIMGEILMIKRLQKSSILDTTAAQAESFVNVPNSDQLQLNLIGRLYIPLGRKLVLEGMVAAPLRKRDVNVDGLTRNISASAGFSVLF